MRTILTTLALMFFFLNTVQSKHHYTFHSIVSLSDPEVKEVQFFIEAQLLLGDRCRYSSKINAFEVISAEAIEAVKIKNALNKRGFFIRVDEAQELVAAGTQKSAIQDEDLALRRAWFAIHHSDWEVIKLVDGLGTSQNETTYIANDGERPYGTAYYRLRQVDFNGASELSDIISMTHFQQLDLMAVFPNPGSGKFKVLFRMFDASPIQLIVHHLSGRIIHDEALKTEEGVNDLILDLSDAPSGTYFLKFVDHYGSTLNQSRISIK